MAWFPEVSAQVQPSLFNVRVVLPERDEVFLMNTLTDAQVVVSADVVEALDRLAADGGASWRGLSAAERAALGALVEHGFIVTSHDEERDALGRYFDDIRADHNSLRVTVLTTLQCNFACGYCIQGDRDHHDAPGDRMTLDTAARVAGWIESRLDAVRPQRFVLTFFGGEPLVNLPVVYFLAERTWAASQARGVEMLVNVITNGLLLSREVVDRLLAFGLSGVKVTLDGERASHDRMRPLRGGQGTFDRILDNLRSVAGRVPLTIGGNFDASNVDTFPALLRRLREETFAEGIAQVSFKPVIRREAARSAGAIPLTAVGSDRRPLGGTCMTVAGAGGNTCDGCHFADAHVARLREETRRHGFAVPDGVHMGPCELHRRHAYAVGPDGALFACPGFVGERALATGHVHDGPTAARAAAAERFEGIAAWKRCGDCAFIPVCGGGCTVAAHHELGDMQAPACHRDGLEAALVSHAYETAGTSGKEGHDEGNGAQEGDRWRKADRLSVADRLSTGAVANGRAEVAAGAAHF